jgi:hypothetical protein
MKPITVRAAVRRVANIRNLNLQMIPCKRYNMLPKEYIFYILYCRRQLHASLKLPCKGLCGKYALV